jgi:hypothetical protein
VTGASSGIGEAFALHHARLGDGLVLVGRNRTQLDRVAADIERLGSRAEVIEADLSGADGVEALGAQISDVDVLIVNAGVTHASTLGSTDRDTLDRLAYLMSAGVVRLCEIAVPPMVARGSGEVVIVSSIAAFTPMRKAAPYAAAKSHATAYARSLAAEVEPKGVRVVAVCPGYVRTDLHRRAGLDHLATSIPAWMWMEPDDVVVATERALRGKKNVVVPGVAYRLVLPFLSSTIAQRFWSTLTRRR